MRIDIEFHSDNKGILTFPSPTYNSETIWFGFPIFVNEKYISHLPAYLKYLSENGIENRPIVSGNMLRQPVIKLLQIDGNPSDFTGAEIIHKRGFFINCISNYILEDENIIKITNVLLNYFKRL